MIKKALIIAPHPDDEINLAGQLIVRLVELNVEVFILYTTNGDAEKKVNNKRIYEAVQANKVLGVDEKHIIFLGYPNEWSGSLHIYNAASTQCMISKLGKSETNSLNQFPEFCFVKNGKHHLFTRENLKSDFKEVIREILPDLIVCPEFDSHPDHRAAALLFDEIMGELLKEDKRYKPIVLKKYDHEGVWYGPKDYYNKPMFPTLTDGPRYYSGGLHDLDSPNFKWEERISYATSRNTNTELLKDNIIYKAAKMHHATTAWYEMQRVINSDMVYWYRPTNNLALNAEITVSSGNGMYINDFKIFDTDDVYALNDPFLNSGNFCWVPDNHDEEKKITIIFTEIQKIKCIRIYEDCNYCNHIKKLKINAENYAFEEIELVRDGSKTEIVFGDDVTTDRIEFRVIEWEGTPGIAEIEIYSDIQKEEEILPIPLYGAKEIESNSSLAQKIERMFLLIKFLFVFKLKYEIGKRI